MADTLRFRGLSTTQITTDTVVDREIVIDIETRELVFGALGSLYRVTPGGGGGGGGGIPEAPLDGQQYARQSGSWAVVTSGGGGGGDASISVSDTPPTSPSEGDLWYDLDTVRTYVYYGGAWVDAAPASTSAAMTDAEVKTAYENNADTNAFTDAEQTKLAGIAAGAEVNPTNVSAFTNDSGYLTDITGQTIGNLSGVTITSASTGEVLRYNGTTWVNAQLAYSDLSGAPVLATVATTGSYSDLSGTPTLATVATTGAYSDLSGLPTLGTAAATATTDYATAAQGALADTALQPTDSIDSLSDVDTSTVAPTDGQALVWDNANSKWEPGTISGGGGDADTLDGLDSTQFLRSDVSDTMDGNLTVNGDVTFTDTATDSLAGPEFTLYRNSASPTDGDYLGQIRFLGKQDNGGDQLYAKITGKTSDVSLGTEDGLIEYAVVKGGTQTIVSRLTGDALKLINGTGLEVAGNITVTGTVDGRDIATDGGVLDTALQPTDSIDALSDVDTTTVAPTDGQALVWDNVNSKWEPGTISGGGGSSVTTSDTAPSSPSDGDLWYDTTEASLYVYYDDGTSSQWVASSSPDVGGGATSIDELSDVDTTTAAPSVGDLLEWNGTNWVPTTPTSSSLAYGCKTMSGTTSLSISDTTVDFDTSIVSSGVTMTTKGIQIQTAGVYELSYNVYGVQTSGNNRMTIRARLTKTPSGSPEVDIDGTKGASYTRDSSFDEGHVSASIIVSLSVGDEIKVVVTRDSSVNGVINEGNISVKQLA